MTSVQRLDESGTKLTRGEKYFEFRHLTRLTVLVAAICIGLILFVDRPVALYMSQLIDGHTFRIWDAITKIGVASPYFIVFISIFLGARFMFVRTAPMPIAGWYATIARTALFGLVCSVIAGITVNLLKFVIGRARPRLFLTEGDYGFFPMNAEWAFNSFPSGHAQTVFTVATIVALAIPRTRYLCFFVATLVALSRVMISVHFVSDIVFGSFLGIGIVLLLKRCAYSDLETLSLEKYQTTGKQN